MHRDDFTTGPTLGIGAFGYVQLVHYTKTNKVYALKALTKKSILKTDQYTHCHDEIANLRASTNPFIVNLFSCFHDAQHIYMVMEFVAGGELYSVIQRGRMRNDDARLLGAEILLGLEFSHSQNVVYRDLKPENVLLGACCSALSCNYILLLLLLLPLLLAMPHHLCWLSAPPAIAVAADAGGDC